MHEKESVWLYLQNGAHFIKRKTESFALSRQRLPSELWMEERH